MLSNKETAKVENNTCDNKQAQNQKHDLGYKGILSNKEEFLYFLKTRIAKPWTHDISAEDMERIDTSYITKEYREIDSDIIYKLKMNGKDVYLYVLLELQSEVDFTMPFRLLRYMVELLNDIFKNTDKNIRERKDFKLPAIVPIVLYNGSDNWTAAMSYREYTENYDIFGDSIIDFNYLLFDLKRMNENKISPIMAPLDIILSVDEYRLKGGALADVTELLDKLLSNQRQNLTNDDLNMLSDWLKYVYFKGDMSPELENEIKQITSKKGITNMKHGIEILMDEQRQKWKEEGIEEGVERGIERGMERGIEKGMERGILRTAKAMKAKGIDTNTIAEVTGMTVDDVLRL
jgi:predicted transposase/invertase (TIGR01784 family)